MKKLVTAALCLWLAVDFTNAQTHDHKQASFRDVLIAARASADRNDMMQRYSALRAYVIQSPEELQAAYEALIDLEGKVTDEEMLRQTAVPVAELIKQCTSPSLRGAIAKLLDQENRKTPLNYKGIEGVSQYHPEKALKEAVHTARLMALLQAAGNGKNRIVLSTLRDMQSKGGLAGEAAADALGKIGDTQDLDHLIGEIKKNPRARIDLSSFGGIVIDRIMQEVNNPDVPAIEKKALIPHLGQAGDWMPENFNAQHLLVKKYATLLDDKDPDVVKISARAIAARVKPEDEALIQKMILSRDRNVRFQALRSMDRIWLNRFAPKVVELLKSDPDDNVRAQAATILGERQVQSAKTPIEQALKDPAGNVRSAAKGALDHLGREKTRK